ncbi:MAG: aminopeptidase [Candidatus Aenigmatarchaeota archaeon]
MDNRIKEQAGIIADWSTEMKEDDNVVILAHAEAEELVIALHEEIGKYGAHPSTLYSSNEASRAYLRNFEGDFKTPDHTLSLFEEADVVISIKSDVNEKAMSDVPGEVLSEYSKVRKPISELLQDRRTCLTAFPTNAAAQLADMSLAEYKDFVWGAILRDWQEVHEKQEILKKKMDEAEEVYITGKETELTMSIKGNIGVNSDGKHNLPSGEVYTAPIPNSVEGDILFDKPMIYSGREIDDVKLTFEDGKVVDYTAGSNEELLGAVLDTDEGSRRVGELGIGTNRAIKRFTRNMLFDEKMGDTIHLALGRAIKRSIGEDGEGNDSAIHMDIIKDMSEGRVEMDDETVMEDGKFIWEM